MKSNITWQCAAFSELSAAQLYAILKVRSEVFVIEQNCVYQDIDCLDLECRHLIAWTEDQQVAAYLRIVPPGLKYAEISLGRVVSSKTARGTGIGKQLLAKAMAFIETEHPGAAVRIQAQAYLENFYQSFGFVTVSDVLLEDGIPHFMMLKPAT
ncbi:MAG: GNAT family N-acetyltransferase [Pseudomonadota bacterium]